MARPFYEVLKSQLKTRTDFQFYLEAAINGQNLDEICKAAQDISSILQERVETLTAEKEKLVEALRLFTNESEWIEWFRLQVDRHSFKEAKAALDSVQKESE